MWEQAKTNSLSDKKVIAPVSQTILMLRRCRAELRGLQQCFWWGVASKNVQLIACLFE
jgi:hypothetical protein